MDKEMQGIKLRQQEMTIVQATTYLSQVSTHGLIVGYDLSNQLVKMITDSEKNWSNDDNLFDGVKPQNEKSQSILQMLMSNHLFCVLNPFNAELEMIYKGQFIRTSMPDYQSGVNGSNAILFCSILDKLNILSEVGQESSQLFMAIQILALQNNPMWEFTNPFWFKSELLVSVEVATKFLRYISELVHETKELFKDPFNDWNDIMNSSDFNEEQKDKVNEEFLDFEVTKENQLIALRLERARKEFHV